MLWLIQIYRATEFIYFKLSVAERSVPALNSWGFSLRSRMEFTTAVAVANTAYRKSFTGGLELVPKGSSQWQLVFERSLMAFFHTHEATFAYHRVPCFQAS